MAISIGANIAALQAQRRLNSATEQLGKSFSQLSSGQRINSAADDAAGVAVADTLRAQKVMTRTVQRNANDGISLLSIADGGLNEISNIITRMNELATQSANGTLSATQRNALSDEFSALWYEWDRLVQTTSFNTITPLYTGLSTTIQVGTDNSTSSRITVPTFNTQPFSILGAIPTTGVNTSANALTTLTRLQAAQSTVASIRGSLGAVESRMRSTVSNLQINGENLSAAESRIRDVDVAGESANLIRLTILQQSGAAVLAQANQAPALALSLLG